MARKPTLSPSKISTYLACPSKYRWTYIDDRGRWYLRSRSYYSFGSTLHKVLQRFHDSGDSGVQTASEAVSALEESWIDAGYANQDEMNQAMAEGKAIIERYVVERQAEPATQQTLFVEKMLRVDLGPFVLLGRLDRIDETEGGGVQVVDYKSGREGVTDDDVSGDLAMGCYQLLLREHFPGRAVSASIVALRTNTRGVASMSDADADEFRRDLVVIGTEILDRDYENLVPVGKAICPKCDFLPLCERHPDFIVPL